MRFAHAGLGLTSCRIALLVTGMQHISIITGTAGVGINP